MLEAAGVSFRIVLPDVDEEAIKQKSLAENKDAAGIAERLADAKAVPVSAKHKDALVLGGDQILVCEDVLFSKASDRGTARAVLQQLRGKNHMLISAAVLAKAGNVLWRRRESATLHMRAFSDAFLDAYLEEELPECLGAVGCYRIEGRGAQLFESVEGDQFCIRGLPLLSVLEALRRQGALAA
jgi:septum formation protein